MNTLRLVPMIAVRDLERALELYEGDLGFRITERCVEDGRLIWCWAKAGATDVMFQRHPKVADRNGGTVLWIYCDDVDGLRSRLIARGCRAGEADTANGRREAECYDLDGNVLMLCQLLDQPAETV